jgi:hypothetical protein
VRRFTNTAPTGRRRTFAATSVPAGNAESVRRQSGSGDGAFVRARRDRISDIPGRRDDRDL